IVMRLGARRSFWLLGSGFLATAVASLLTSWYLKIDIIFAPLAMGAVSAVVAVQLYRLWLIDSLLTDRVNETSSRTDLVEATVGPARIANSLKLLHTILPLVEAVVFQPNEIGDLVHVAGVLGDPHAASDP